MQKAVFFTGRGTAYGLNGPNREELDVYPETLAALRLLGRRGYVLVLASNSSREYRSFLNTLKDKTLPLYHCNLGETDAAQFIKEYGFRERDCYYVTDGLFLNKFWRLEGKLVLVLTGKGLDTLNSLTEKDLSRFFDICKDFYAAACSIALHTP